MREQKKNFSLLNFLENITTKQAIWIIVILGFIVYFNSLLNGFVEDDLPYIIDNPLTHSINILNSFKPNLFNVAGQYRPIAVLYFSILYTFFKSTPFFYHLIQLTLHISAAIIVYVLFRKFFPSLLSIFLAVIFLVHPINIESVSYIAQTINPLFFLLGILPIIIVRRKNLEVKEISIIILLLLLSIFTKETGILFLLLLFSYIALFRKSRNNLPYLSIGGVLILILYFLTRFFIGKVYFSARPLIPIADQNFVGRLINIPEIIFYYLKTFFFPVKLAIDQQWVIASISFDNFYAPLIVGLILFTIILVIGVHLYKTSRLIFKYYLFFFIWFIFGLSLNLQIFPLDKTVADRWFYFPMVGLLGLIGASITSIKNISRSLRTITIFSGILIILLLSFRTIIRNKDWKDTITLYSHDIKYNDNFDIENGLGVAYGRQKDYPRALEHLIRSVNMRPFEYNLSNLAVIYATIGDIQNAKLYFDKALHAKDYKLYDSHKYDLKLYKNYVVTLLFLEKDSTSSLAVLKEALKDYPDSSLLWSYLAITYYMQEDKDNALFAANRAYILNRNPQNNYIYQTIKDNKILVFNFEDFNGKMLEMTIPGG